MRALHVRVDGTDVKRWQRFLRGRGHYLGTVDGDFYTKSKAATADFQGKEGKRFGLEADGWAGRETFTVAALHGFELCPVAAPPTRVARDPDWPPRPTKLQPLGQAGRQRLFGAFKFKSAPTARNPEAIKITNRGETFKIARAQVPELIGVRGFPKSGNVFMHALAAEPLQELVDAWDEAALLHLVEGWAGSYVPRFIRGSRKTLSAHAWGTAFDINVPQNGLGARPASVGKKGSVRELVPIANRLGWFWGGHFRSRPDGMHFELSRV